MFNTHTSIKFKHIGLSMINLYRRGFLYRVSPNNVAAINLVNFSMRVKGRVRHYAKKWQRFIYTGGRSFPSKYVLQTGRKIFKYHTNPHKHPFSLIPFECMIKIPAKYSIHTTRLSCVYSTWPFQGHQWQASQRF